VTLELDHRLNDRVIDAFATLLTRESKLRGREPVTQDCVTGSDLRELVAGVGFEPT
jgi:hypothetical protein